MEKTNNLKTPIELFGVECGKGWYKIIEPLFNYIENYNKDKNEDEKIQILQVKEKFGSLRFYTNFHTEELYEMIKKAEDQSWYICEFCGTDKYIGHTRNWITTCCIDCITKHIKESTFNKKEIWVCQTDDKDYFINKENCDEILKIIKK